MHPSQLPPLPPFSALYRRVVRSGYCGICGSTMVFRRGRMPFTMACLACDMIDGPEWKAVDDGGV